jgi:hypothetical protein
MLPDTAYYTSGLSITKEQSHPETQPGEMFFNKRTFKGYRQLKKIFIAENWLFGK